MTTADTNVGKTAGTSYDQLRAFMREGATIGSIGSLLGWDQQTYMPALSAPHRADQLAYISSLSHQHATDPRVGELLDVCQNDASLMADPLARANVREMRRDYDRRVRLPVSLVSDLARTTSAAQHAWQHARETSNFDQFSPHLEQVLELTRRKAECYGVPDGGELYDALLEDYEPGCTARELDDILTPLCQRVSELVKELNQQGKQPDDSPTRVPFDADQQHEFGIKVLTAIGFRFDAGRLDTTAHPFCSGMAPGDTRLTTRYRDERFTDALYGTLHEGGHGLYEQGLPKLADDGHESRFGEPLGSAVSLGIHESQSRLWENQVGRSREFWEWALPIARTHAPALASVTPEMMHRATNTATPSLIRVEADEATYNIHVFIRYQLERAMLRGDLAVKDLPGEWNALYKEYLNIDVPDDRRGCLQDVHWSHGLVGYFPTYSLGNLYASQLWESVQQAIPDLSARIARGEFAELLAWLREHIHQHGRRYTAGELCKQATGEELSPEPLIRHLRVRLEPVYLST